MYICKYYDSSAADMGFRDSSYLGTRGDHSRYSIQISKREKVPTYIYVIMTSAFSSRSLSETDYIQLCVYLMTIIKLDLIFSSFRSAAALVITIRFYTAIRSDRLPPVYRQLHAPITYAIWPFGRLLNMSKDVHEIGLNKEIIELVGFLVYMTMNKLN